MRTIVTPRRGTVLVYYLVTFAVLMAFASLAVDLGRARLAKVQLQDAADAASLAAAQALRTSSSAATTAAVAAAAANTVEGHAVALVAASDIEYGLWDTSARTFTPVTSGQEDSATAVRVTARLSQARGTAVPTLFAKLIGFNQINITATSTATRGQMQSVTVNGLSCLWLAGMPNGAVVSAYDGNWQDTTAPTSSPFQVTGVPLTAGQSIYFRDFQGTTGYAGVTGLDAEGDTGWIVTQQSANGINSTSAPIGSLVGVFLDSSVPSGSSAAASLNFSSSTSRDFSTLSPALKQVFFIGDGVNSSGKLQAFVVPTGATRLYLGIMDEKGWWWDNTGSLSTSIITSRGSLVK